jgi:hypothetical protein
MSSVDIEVSGLRTFYASDRIGKMILDHLAGFVNNMGTTKVDQLAWRLSSEQDPPDRWQIIKFFRRLEDFRCGRLIEGRKGHKTRFEWSAGLVDVARTATGQNVSIGPAPVVKEGEIDDAAGNGLVEHPYLLRRDLHIHLRLPADLTRSEASRLAAFIQTLPFESITDVAVRTP